MIVESEGDGLQLAIGNVVSAAVEMSAGGEVEACVLAKPGDGEKFSELIACYEGISRVLFVEHENLSSRLAEIEAKVFSELIRSRDYQGVVVGATTYGKNLLPRIGALLDLQPLSDVTDILGDGVFRRPIYAGNAILTVGIKESIHLISIRMTSFEEMVQGSNSSPIERLEMEVGDYGGRVKFEGLTSEDRDTPELTTSKIVISGGRGMQSGDNFAMLERVALKLNAAVGASRAAVDAGFVSNDLQVGQTGKVVAPDLYIAVGISGAIQHLAGMKDSKTIVAINNDEDAPIFQIADVGLVEDLFKALPELESLL